MTAGGDDVHGPPGVADFNGVPRILLDLAEGRLDPGEVDAVLGWLRASAEEPPPWVVNRAARIARQAAAVRPARPRLLQRLTAALVYDNRRQLRPAGARAAGAEPPRLRYRAGGLEVDLELGTGSRAGRLLMLGQVTAGEADVARAWVAADGPGGRLEAGVDDLGQFALDGLLPGRHRLEIGLTSALIAIPELEL
jgi:hypothetical protein